MFARFISHYAVLSPDTEVDEVVESHLRNAENSCESNSFYLDMYVDESCLSPVWIGRCTVQTWVCSAKGSAQRVVADLPQSLETPPRKAA